VTIYKKFNNIRQVWTPRNIIEDFQSSSKSCDKLAKSTRPAMTSMSDYTAAFVTIWQTCNPG